MRCQTFGSRHRRGLHASRARQAAGDLDRARRRGSGEEEGGTPLGVPLRCRGSPRHHRLPWHLQVVLFSTTKLCLRRRLRAAAERDRMGAGRKRRFAMPRVRRLRHSRLGAKPVAGDETGAGNAHSDAEKQSSNASGSSGKGPTRQQNNGLERRFVSYVATHPEDDDEAERDGLSHAERLALEQQAISLIRSREPLLQVMPAGNKGFDLIERTLLANLSDGLK
jgi:hypothetical protein